MRIKPAGSVPLYETLTLWANNKTSKWLDQKSEAERDKLFQDARINAPALHQKFKARRESIRKQKIEILLSKQASKEKAEIRDNERKVIATNRIATLDKVWVTTEEIDRELSKLDQKQVRETILPQQDSK